MSSLTWASCAATAAPPNCEKQSRACVGLRQEMTAAGLAISAPTPRRSILKFPITSSSLPPTVASQENTHRLLPRTMSLLPMRMLPFPWTRLPEPWTMLLARRASTMASRLLTTVWTTEQSTQRCGLKAPAQEAASKSWLPEQVQSCSTPRRLLMALLVAATSAGSRLSPVNCPRTHAPAHASTTSTRTRRPTATDPNIAEEYYQSKIPCGLYQSGFPKVSDSANGKVHRVPLVNRFSSSSQSSRKSNQKENNLIDHVSIICTKSVSISLFVENCPALMN